MAKWFKAHPSEQMITGWNHHMGFFIFLQFSHMYKVLFPVSVKIEKMEHFPFENIGHRLPPDHMLLRAQCETQVWKWANLGYKIGLILSFSYS